jgi:hypothetical protein
MTMPGFNAEAALSPHYRSNRRVARAFQRIDDELTAAMDEVIEVYGCAPGFLQLGEGENMVCIPSWGGDGGGGTGGGPGPGDGPTGPPGPEGEPAATRCGCEVRDTRCRARARANRAKHARCEREIAKCVEDYCKGKTHAELGECEKSCTDIVGEKPVCKADPCFKGVPCTQNPDGSWDCRPIPGCPGTYGPGEQC